MMTPKELIEFEDDIANEFNQGKIRAPVHLDNGNEEQLIDIFTNVKKDDWVCCSWRSHYRCLLKGVPKDKLKSEIMKGHSISLCFPEHNVISSAIVGGIVPIAVGLAWGIKLKRKSSRSHVYCFVGEMTALSGGFYESWRYSVQNKLPITFVIENNQKSVCTITKEVWKLRSTNDPIERLIKNSKQQSGVIRSKRHQLIYFEYTSKWPHAGAGKRVQF